MHRSAPRLTRILACAAVPVMLVVAGCSSDSDGKDTTAKDPSGSSSAAPGGKESKPVVAPAKYSKLPVPCKAIVAKSIDELVPKAKTKAGTPGKSSDTANRGGCSWNGLDDKGLKGSQYRWLDVAFFRYGSDEVLGSGEKRAKDGAAKETAKVQATEGAKNVVTKPAAGIGSEATSIAYSLRKTGEDFSHATIVARTENVVIVLDYNGTGFGGAGAPAEKTMMDGATKAAKEAVAAVAAANK